MADLELIRKLLIKPGGAVALLDVPAEYVDRFRDAELSIVDPGDVAGRADTALLFAPDRAAFEHGFDALTSAVAPGGRVWACYPKRQKSDLNRNGIRELAETHGWTPVTQIAVDDDWSAMRLRPIAEVGT